MTFGAHKLVHSEPFLDYLDKIWHLLSATQRYIATCGKKLYRCTSTFSALNYFSGIFFQIHQLSIRCGAHKIFHRFLISAIFDRNFSEFVTPSSDEYENYVLPLKARSLPKKVKTASELIHINRHTILVRTMSPSNKQWSGLGAWQIKK